jgi:hypothetical protein
MEKLRKLYMLHQYTEMLIDNPRVTHSHVHRTISPYDSLNSTSRLIREAHNLLYILGPLLFSNTGFSFELKKGSENPLHILRDFEYEKRQDISHAIALSGDYNILLFKKGGSDLSFAHCIVPHVTFNEGINFSDFIFKEKEGDLPFDKLPTDWSEMDFKVFDIMQKPKGVSYGKAAGKLGVKWITVKRHYEKIINDCKVMCAFFPLTYSGYSRLIACFETKYEIGLFEKLHEVDRSSYLWKCNNMIILTMFVNDYNSATEQFFKLEEIGMIKNVKISIPIRYYTSKDFF